MKAKLLPLTIIISAGLVNAQESDFLHINDVKARYSANGQLFAAPDMDWESYIVQPFDYPIGDPYPPHNTLGVSHFWIGALDTAGQLYLAAALNEPSGADFWAGPVADDYLDPDYLSRYNRVWVVNADVIENHIAFWNTAGYTVPEQLADWPGNGNIANGEPEQLAPYFDYNNNSIYDPENGDYPIIRGDQAVYMITNDIAGVHTYSGGTPLQVELHMMAYAYNMPSDSAMRKTTFFNIQIINRSPIDYIDMKFGMYNAFDLGAYDDNYVGSDPSRNMYFVYNADLIDGPTSPNYGPTPPAQSVKFLNTDLSSFIQTRWDSIIGHLPETTDEFWYRLNGKWLDGSSMTFGGNGMGGVSPTNYLFTGTPLDTSTWSEYSISAVGSIREALGATSIYELLSNDTACIDMAFTTAFCYEPIIFGADTSFNLPFNTVEVLKTRVDDVQEFYDSNFSECLITSLKNPDYTDVTNSYHDSEFHLYPNPANQYIYLQSGIKGIGVRNCKFYNASGNLIKSVQSNQIKENGISIAELPAGMYVVVFNLNNGETWSSTFSKQ